MDPVYNGKDHSTRAWNLCPIITSIRSKYDDDGVVASFSLPNSSRIRLWWYVELIVILGPQGQMFCAVPSVAEEKMYIHT